MNKTLRLVLRLLDETISILQRSLSTLEDADDRRFMIGSMDLIRFETHKLENALKSGDVERTRYALRSVIGLTKGVLDIGASWTFTSNSAKRTFDEAMAQARDAIYSA